MSAIGRRLAIGCGLGVLLLAGCGSQSASDQRMNNRFDALDAKMATEYETAASPYNNLMEKGTHEYIALVRHYARQLGPKEARRRLLAKSDEVSSFCLPCAGELRDEARRY